MFAGPLTLLPSIQIINGYGPTENTTFTCCYPVPRELSNDLTSIPIGRPISNTEVYILDGDLNPVPVGVFGELYTGGAGLARGYLNDKELTDERFIANPFSKNSGERLYKTGDIVRYLPDSNIEFSRRLDNQVKIRGFRIELGEIETVLEQHPNVQKTAVIVREYCLGDKRLEAYVVPVRKSFNSNNELRRHMKDRLPGYMVPSVIVFIDTIPLTTNGKIDTDALPKPEQAYHGDENNFVGPGNELERQLTKVWEQLLDVQPVGITDNFFELGGHSLLAVRLISEIKRTTGNKLSVKDLFHNPTILQLAESIMSEDSSDTSPLVMIKSGESKVPLFWVHEPLLVHHLDKDYPLYVLVHPPQNRKVSLHPTICEIAAYYVQEIRKVQPEGPYALGGFCFWSVIALEIARQLIKHGQEVPLLFLVNPSPHCLPVVSSVTVGQKVSNTFISRSIHHVCNLKHLQNGEKISYMVQKIPALFRWFRTKSYIKPTIKTKTSICKAFLRLGRPVPRCLMKFYIIRVYARELLRKYNFRVYPGRVVVVQSEEDNKRDQLDWTKFADYDVKLHVVPESGHVDILQKEVHLKVWTKWLNLYLRNTSKRGSLNS